MTAVCKRYLVTGHVQGVFFRASARERARELNLTGYARNLPDGRVEVLACGDADAVGRLGEWLEEGPPRARVDSVQAQDSERPAPAGFDVR